MYTHTNLKLEQCLHLYETGLLPWDIEMTVEESLSDDEDGVPDRGPDDKDGVPDRGPSVSDSESESESGKDSD